MYHDPANLKFATAARAKLPETNPETEPESLPDVLPTRRPKTKWTPKYVRAPGMFPEGEGGEPEVSEPENGKSETREPEKREPENQARPQAAGQAKPEPQANLRLVAAALIFGAGAALVVAAGTFEFHRARLEISAAQLDLRPATAGVPAASAAAPGVVAARDACAEAYTVVRGDSLSKIAQRAYRDGSKYMVIYSANRDRLSEPDLVLAGDRIRIPCR